LTRCPQLATLATLTADFAKIYCNRRGDQLPDWLTAVEATELTRSLWDYVAT
jgi:hypothetical protein